MGESGKERERAREKARQIEWQIEGKLERDHTGIESKKMSRRESKP
jgi:hypothetical protein